jgi:hypothetical protein
MTEAHLHLRTYGRPTEKTAEDRAKPSPPSRSPLNLIPRQKVTMTQRIF